MFNTDSLRVYPGHQMCHVKLDPLATAASNRRLRVSLDTVYPDSEAADEIEGGTYIRVLGLQNDVTYRVWVIHEGETWDDFPDGYETVKPCERFITPARTEAPSPGRVQLLHGPPQPADVELPVADHDPVGELHRFAEMYRAEQIKPLHIGCRVAEGNYLGPAHRDDTSGRTSTTLERRGVPVGEVWSLRLWLTGGRPGVPQYGSPDVDR
jgi:hypothetical protein